jgi:hypothetical protein
MQISVELIIVHTSGCDGLRFQQEYKQCDDGKRDTHVVRDVYQKMCLSKYVCVCCGVLRYCYCLYTTLQS